MNVAFKIIIEILIILVIWALITLFVFAYKLFKSLKLISEDTKHLTNNLEEIKQKTKIIKKTTDNLKIVVSAFIIASLLRKAKKDYKKSKHKSITKSIAKVCLTNISTIQKIRFI